MRAVGKGTLTREEQFAFKYSFQQATGIYRKSLDAKARSESEWMVWAGNFFPGAMLTGQQHAGPPRARYA